MKPEEASQTLTKMQESWARRMLLLVRRMLRYWRMSGKEMRRRARRKRRPNHWRLR